MYTVDNAGNSMAKTDQRAAVTSNYGYDVSCPLAPRAASYDTRIAELHRSNSNQPCGEVHRSRACPRPIRAVLSHSSNNCRAVPRRTISDRISPSVVYSRVYQEWRRFWPSSNRVNSTTVLSPELADTAKCRGKT